jgi:hypothetical protein
VLLNRGRSYYPLVLLLLAFCLSSCAAFSAQTRLELTEPATGEKLIALTLKDGETAVLKWRNSLFDLDVTERFVAEAGVLVLTEVTFADPAGSPPVAVQPGEAEGLYQTGGPFSARGLRKPFTEITCRIGEIGHPKLEVGGRVVDLKRAAAFGGQVRITARKPTLFERLLNR